MFETEGKPWNASTRRHVPAIAEPKRKRKKAEPKRHSLEAPGAQEMWRRLLSFWTQEIDRQKDNRTLMDLDHRCYDNEQWSASDLAILKARGQKPLTLNVTATTLNWILGSERRARVDFKVISRRKDYAKAAEDKTSILKYLGDVNHTPFHRSRAFADAAKGGVGWIEDGAQDDDDGEPVYSRYESWRNMLWDSAATEFDLSDARYIFRSKWVDVDIAKMWFPDRETTIHLAAQHASTYGGFDLSYGDEIMDHAENQMTLGGSLAGTELGYFRHRVRIIECWFRAPAAVRKIRGGQFNGEVLDEWSPGHLAEVESGEAEIAEKTDLRMHVAVMTTAGLLHLSESPYRHNRSPFTPIWAYRRDSDNMPYGVIRNIRGVQEDINWRFSKALHILSTNKTIMDRDAVEDIDQYLEEASRADAVIEIKPGARFEMNADRDLAPAHMEMMSVLLQMVQQVGGVTDEMMGRATNAKSGIAIEARQDQGQLSTSGLFDNLRLATQLSGEKQVSLVEQFFTKAKQIRITSARGKPTYLDINAKESPTAEQIPFSKADFIISEEAWRATIRQAQAEQLLALARELAATAPQAVIAMLDLLIEAMDLPNGEEIVSRIRAVTGMSDPDSDEPSPEEIARKEDEARQKERMERMQEAEIAEKEASAGQKSAAAEKLLADIKAAVETTVAARVGTMQAAMEAALAAISAPGVAPVADKILNESGFKSRSEQDEEAAIDAQASELEALAAEGAAMQQQAAAMQQQEMVPA